MSHQELFAYKRCSCMSHIVSAIGDVYLLVHSVTRSPRRAQTSALMSVYLTIVCRLAKYANALLSHRMMQITVVNKKSELMLMGRVTASV